MITITELLDLKKIFNKPNKMVIFHNWSNPISMLSNFHLSSSLDNKLIEFNVTYNPTINSFLEKKFRIKNGSILINNKEANSITTNSNYIL